MSEGLNYPGASPGELVGALHDRVHQDTGASRPAKAWRATPSTPGREGLYPPESRSPEAPRAMLTMRATINLADLERHLAAGRAGGTGEGIALAAALALPRRKAAP